MSGGSIFGKWKLRTNENFEEYMEAIGVNFFLRKAGARVSSISEILEESDGKIRFKTTSTVKSANDVFDEGEETDEKTMDGRECKTVVTREGDRRLTQVQTWDGGKRTSVLKWIHEDDDTMVVILEYQGIIARRVHVRV